MNMDSVHPKSTISASSSPGIKEITLIINFIPTCVLKLEQVWFDGEL